NKPNFIQIIISSLSRLQPFIFATKSRRLIKYIGLPLLSIKNMFKMFEGYGLSRIFGFKSLVLETGGLPRLLDWLEQIVEKYKNFEKIKEDYHEQTYREKSIMIPDNREFIIELLRQRNTVNIEHTICKNFSDLKW